MRRDRSQNRRHGLARLDVEVVQLRDISPGGNTDRARRRCRPCVRWRRSSENTRVTARNHPGAEHVTLGVLDDPGMIEGGVVRDEVEAERHAAIGELTACGIEPLPPTHPIIGFVGLNAVRGPAYVRVRPSWQHPIVLGSQRRVGTGNLATDGAAAPHAHQEHAVVSAFREDVPARARYVGKRDQASLGAGDALEPRPGADLNQMGIAAHSSEC